MRLNMYKFLLLAAIFTLRIERQLEEPCADLLRVFLGGRNGAITVGRQQQFHGHGYLEYNRYSGVDGEGIDAGNKRALVRYR